MFPSFFEPILALFMPFNTYLASLVIVLMSAIVGFLAALLWINYRYGQGLDWQRNRERYFKREYRSEG